MAGLSGSTAELRGSVQVTNEKLIAAERIVASIQTEKEQAMTELDIVLNRVTAAKKAKEALEEKVASCQVEAASLK